jgi:hypothetical protein
VAFGEFIEHLELKGIMTDIPETIIFDMNNEGLIRRMSLYLKQPGGPPRLAARTPRVPRRADPRRPYLRRP